MAPEALGRYQRLTRQSGGINRVVYLSGTNTERGKKALFALFKDAVSKDVVSRTWGKGKVSWDP